MNQTGGRRFAILDAMGLVVVISIALALTRTTLSFYQGRPLLRGTYAYLGSAWVVQFTMLTLIPIRLLRRHAPDGRLGRHPGWLACNAVGLASVLTIAQLVLAILTDRAGWTGPLFPTVASLIGEVMVNLIMRLPGSSPVAVAVAWTTLALLGGREPGGGWVERVAVLCGVYLLVLPVLRLVFAWLGRLG
jgi:hypothetical protein